MPLYYYLRFLVFAFCCFSTSLLAQNEIKIDSLQRKLKLAKDDTRFLILNELFKATNTTDYKKSLDYANEFYALAVSRGDSVRMVQGGRMRAYSLMDMAKNDLAAEALVASLGIAKRNLSKHPELKTQIKFLLNNAGLAYTYLGNYDKALQFHYQSLQIREEEGDQKSIRTALNNIGLVFYYLKDDEKAIQNYLKAIEISKALNDFVGMERVYINLGLSYNRLGKFNEAIKFFEEGFTLCRDECDENIVKEGLEGLGYSYKANHQLSVAKEKFLKSLEIARKQNDKRYSAENLFELGTIEIELKHENEGMVHIMEAKSLAESVNLAEAKLSIYKELAKIYGAKRDFEQSLFYQSKYAQFKDSIMSEQVIKNLTKVQTNYDQRANLKTIAEKNQMVALQREVIVRQQRQNLFIIAIACLIVSLATLLYYFTRRQQQINRELTMAKTKIEEQNTQLANYNRQLEEKVIERTKDLIHSNDALQQVNDELDHFIYKTSHDIRGPLATLKGMCNIALMDIKDDLAVSYLKKLDITADRMNTILTRLMIVNQINASVLMPVKIDFQEILEEIFQYERKKGLPQRFSLTYHVEPDCSVISDVALVKIVLENLIDNSIKFYNNSARLDPYANVRIFKTHGIVRATIEDNGIGLGGKEGKEIFRMFMRASERSEIGGIGLYLSKIATEKMGGEVTLLHSDTKGSVFEVIFPPDLNEVINNRNVEMKKLVAFIEKQSDPNTKPSSTVI